MLVDLSNAVGGYLHDVFVREVGLVGAARLRRAGVLHRALPVQWIASERAGKSVIPIAFWWCSIGGGLLLFVYALYRRDPVFILGQGFGVFVYLRNL